MIRAQGLHVTFGPGTPMETRALQGVDLEIPAGQYVSLIGSNGAGKSTLLNCLTGEVALDQGSIVIDESEVTAWPAPRRAALVARVFQDPLAGTCEGLTIEENMALAAARGTRRGLSPALHRARREEFAANPQRVREILADGASQARSKAGEVLHRVQKACGIRS